MAMQILEEMDQFFSAFADRTRLRIINLMRDGEVCVCFFTEVLGESQPKISRHLAYLRKSGLVSARREGKWMHYSIDYPEQNEARETLDSILNWLGSDPDLQEDLARLVKVCLSGDVPVTIQRAPKPESVAGEEPRFEEENEVVEEEMETFLL